MLNVLFFHLLQLQKGQLIVTAPSLLLAGCEHASGNPSQLLVHSK